MKAEYRKAREFFEEVVLTYEGNDCLVWPYCRNQRGYGILRHEGYTTKFVHRLACARVHGPGPTSRHQAAHSCGNGSGGCCNPNHLSWKTPEGNAQDKVLHGTANRGERQGNSKLTTEQVLEIRFLARSIPQVELSLMFGVGDNTISCIVNRKSWAWLKDMPDDASVQDFDGRLEPNSPRHDA
jgi:hypothetical protein